MDTRTTPYFGAFFTLITLVVIGYFAFAATQGNYGLFRLIQVQAQAELLQEDLAALKSEREALENRTRRLSSEHLDLDLLDERARAVLGFARGDEIIIR
ncbi:MAG: septum formation initiator family protein [Pseudomonadota bacterium]